jgi:uncharacterized membrane protein
MIKKINEYRNPHSLTDTIDKINEIIDYLNNPEPIKKICIDTIIEEKHKDFLYQERKKQFMWEKDNKIYIENKKKAKKRFKILIGSLIFLLLITIILLLRELIWKYILTVGN